MDMPKPGDAHKKLSALIGEWSGTEKLHPSPWDPAGGTAEARVINRWVADGFAVVQEYEQSRNGQVTFRGHGVFWFDPQRDEYVMHWWDSMGGAAGEFRGRFDGNVLALASPMPQGGHSRTSWTLTGDDAHDFLMEMSPDGQSWAPAMEGQYRKAVRTGARKAARKAKKAAASTRARKATPARKAAAARSTSKPRVSRKKSGGRARKGASGRSRRR